MAATDGTPAAGPAPLKRLAFVHSASARLAEGAAKLYTERARPLAPKFAERLESTVAAYAPTVAPVVASAADTAEKALLVADEKVDQFYLAASKYLSVQPLRDLHTSNMAVFRAAFERYANLVHSTSDYVSSKLSTEHTVQRAREALAQTLEKAKEMTDPDVAVRTVYDAWMAFAAIPAVAKTLQSATPLTQKGADAFVAAHDALVASPLYARSLSLGASTLGWAAATTPYRLGATYLYPWVQPVAEPALDKVAKSTYVNSTLKYWAPVAAA